MLTMLGVTDSCLAEWSPHVTLASDAVSRGLSETAGKPSVVLGLDWSGERWFAGGRLANSRLPSPVNPTLDSGMSLGAYAGYSWPVTTDWSLTGVLARYEFVGSTGYRAIDGYSELAISLGDEQWHIEMALADDAWGQSGLTRYTSVSWQQPWPSAEQVTVDVTAGYANANRSLTWEYPYLELGASYSQQQWSIDARAHFIDDVRVNRSGWSQPRSRLVMSFSYFW